MGMTTAEARQKVLEAFESSTFCYSQVLPLQYTDFIDGMAWVGLLCGASRLVGDKELAKICENFLSRLLAVGPDARNFAPKQVTSEWIKSPSLEGFWYREKPQSFAGPAGLRFAIDCGAPLNDPFQIKSKSRMMTLFGGLFGFALSHSIPWLSEGLRQHINSMFLAYLVLGKRPATSLLWLCEGNPFFSYIAGIKCSVEYPDPTSMSEGHTVEENALVPLKDRKPSSWIFRDWVKSRYVREGTVSQTYTPIWQVVGDYLQSKLEPASQKGV